MLVAALLCLAFLSQASKISHVRFLSVGILEAAFKWCLCWKEKAGFTKVQILICFRKCVIMWSFLLHACFCNAN